MTAASVEKLFIQVFDTERWKHYLIFYWSELTYLASNISLSLIQVSTFVVMYSKSTKSDYFMLSRTKGCNYDKVQSYVILIDFHMSSHLFI